MPNVWRPYCQMQTAKLPRTVVSTEGNCLVLEDGTRLVDGISCWWTTCHGHRHPHMISAVEQQLHVMPHVMLGGLTHPQVERLAERIAKICPGDLDHVFFSDSGSVAVEVAMKMAVQFWINQGVRGRDRFLSFVDSYHGDTTGAMSICDPNDGMHAHFKGFLLEQYPRAIPVSEEEFAEFEHFVLQNTECLAGIVIEPLVQAAGGLRFHTPQQLKRIEFIARAHNLLLICDEVATGFGRTGKMFASEIADVVPDIMCIGKGMSGGMLGIAATVARRHVFDAFQSQRDEDALMHGPTFMGNPMACAAANASLDLFENEPRLNQVAEIAATCLRKLEPLRGAPHVRDVRVLGAFAVVEVECVLDQDYWMTFFVERGVWLRPTRDVFYIAPPFTIQAAELDTLCDAVVEAVHRLESHLKTF
ncbi:MAG: adenosylmethionine--8-amino-7-oxononanoate transaminase [Pirellulaceae bacterium]